MVTNAEHFRTLLWKNFVLELDSPSKYVWAFVTVFFLGLGTGTIAGNTNMPGSYIPVVMTSFMFLQCGFIGRMIAVNLVRDRKVKFRLTLQNVGVRQAVYMAANFAFSIIWGAVQILVLLIVIYISMMIAASGNDRMDSLNLDFANLFNFFITTIFFLLAYLAMCAAFSGFIKQYEFAGEVIGKFTFLSIFIPVAYVVSTFLAIFGTGDENRFYELMQVNYTFIWLPNVTYLQTGVRMAIKTAEPKLADKADSLWLFNAILFLQFVGYMCVYYLVDRYISTDTGAQRQLINRASDHLADLGDQSMPGLQEPLMAAKTDTQHGGPSATIKIRQLVKKFGDFTALNNVNLDIHSNGITCLLGHNGAGKTTLIDILTGFQAPTSGGVYLNNQNIHTNIEMLYGRVGYASSHDPLFEEITVQGFLVLVARLKGVPNPMGEAMRVARDTHLEPHLYKKIRECSGGTKRRVSISSAIVGNPSLVFLDEPSTGVDPENRRALWDLIAQMRRSDRIILLTTHHLEEAEYLSQDVIILNKGQISLRGGPEEIKSELGVGYKIIVSDMAARRDFFFQTFAAFLPYMTVVEDRLQSIGELKLEMRRNTNEVVVQILRALEANGLRYSILAATLEDAFINLGEKDETLEEEAAKTALMEQLFVRTFTTNVSKKILALLMRKLYLLFRSLLQVVVILMLISLPSAMYYLIVSYIYAAINNFGDYDPPKKLANTSYMGILNIICILYYTMSCGFFGLTPVVERLARIRYLMKMNNVSWVSYLPTLLLPDVIIAAGLVLVTYGISYVASSNLYESFNASAFWLLGLNLFVWLLTFIAQSYFLSFWFATKEGAYKRLTQILLLSNVAALVILGYSLAYIANEGFNRGLVEVFHTLFPGYGNIYYCGSMIDNRENISIESMYEILRRSAICFVIFFSAAVYMDYNSTKIVKATNSLIRPPMGMEQLAFDPQAVRAEKAEALRETDEFPIQVREVSKVFANSFFALADVSIALRPREVLGLIGPNGAGKSTMFNIVSNYLSPTSGEIKYHGKYLDENLEFYNKTGLCAQDDIIWPELSVDQHLNFYAKLKGVDKHTVHQWKVLMGLEGFGQFSSINLSTGMKRKLCYIISMMSNPQYKFLDEPTSGLDPVARKLMRKLITAQKNTYGGCCVFTTHTMKDAEDLCDRVAILVNGRLTCIDTVNNLRTKTGGVNVSFLRNLASPNMAADEQEIYQVFSENFPESLERGQPVVIDRTERKIVFYAPNIADFPGKLETLLNLKRKAAIHDFEISQRSLEDLFLYLARGQTARLQA